MYSIAFFFFTESSNMEATEAFSVILLGIE